jgi:hypothetical protein
MSIWSDVYQMCMMFEVLLFGSTFLSKLVSWRNHRNAVRRYLPGMSEMTITTAAIVTCGIDGAIVVASLFSQNSIVASTVGLFSLMLYTAITSRRVSRSSGAETCACGGLAGDHELSYMVVLRNALFAIPFVVMVIGHGSLLNSIRTLPLMTSILEILTLLSLLTCINLAFTSIGTIRLIREKIALVELLK